ncbi:Protein EARLY FLOWERING 3 [Abeliophyllum distichum]|uniref:Protein EARLY FLOWERING 3 n=1 Tax=Abeliophyllum distichum TaxID=126358 RepID=A0ABD1P0T3_9LAMI
MKRGKYEEKIMGPMFPRLHVNDAEKGGPRAPPRNKMALYEQLSIPSQRFSQGVLPPNPTNTTPHSVPSASSSQLAGKERGMFFSQQLPPGHLAEEPHSQQSDLGTPTVQVERKKKLDEDDFRVPIFNHTRTSQDHGKYANDMDREKPSPPYPANSNHSTTFRKTKQTSMVGHSMGQEGESRKEANKKEFVAGQDQLDKATSRSSSIDKMVGSRKQTDASLCFEPRDDPANVIDQSKAGHIVRPLLCAEPQSPTDVHSNGALREHSIAMDKENSSTSKRDFPSEHDTVHDVRKYIGSREDRSCWSLQKGNMDRVDSVYKTSMVESLSEQDVSPDDVIGVIGQKHFWKARRAIVNQQRTFAVQVFELHRLIKVQRLIAGLPHLSVEDTSYLSKPVKASPAKKLPFDYIVKALPGVPKKKGDFEKPDHTVECSTENIVGKASLSSMKNGVLPSNGRPFSENPLAPSMRSNPNVRQWCFNPPHGQQWSPEGLVYKPYNGPEFVGPVYGPPGSTPVMGNFSTPAYGVPAPHHQYQLPSFPPAGPHSYFPPYGMPMLNPAFSGSSMEQMNPLATPGKLLAGEANFIAEHQNLFNIPCQKSEARLDVPRLCACKNGELQGNTASSPALYISISNGVSSTVERQDARPLFSASYANDVPDSGPQPPEHEHPARAIKVVPHNARSATESAARIFRIIQEERKMQDSV